MTINSLPELVGVGLFFYWRLSLFLVVAWFSFLVVNLASSRQQGVGRLRLEPVLLFVQVVGFDDCILARQLGGVGGPRRTL